MAPLASVLIPTFNRRASVAQALAALARQTLDPSRFEVIVVIDGAEDGTAQMVDEWTAPFTLRGICQPNKGAAAARNTAIHAAKGEILIFLDDDMEPAAECVEQHIREHANQQRCCILAAVPMPIGPTSSAVQAFVAEKFNQHLAQLAQPDYQLTQRDFYSGHFSIRRSVLLEVGLFDEQFTIYGNEDVELFLRLRMAAVDVRYCSHIVAHQHYDKTFQTLAHDQEAKGRTAILLARKHPQAQADSKLESGRTMSWRWKVARSTLLKLTDVLPGIHPQLISCIGWAERYGLQQIGLIYTFVLDYSFWVGVRRAIREQQVTGDTTVVTGQHGA
jgi:glycosyltransferase involved in cell wall biosynthesis